jgi:DNA-binding NarL/FixJ family response regulator
MLSSRGRPQGGASPRCIPPVHAMTDSARLVIVCDDQLHGQCLKEALLARGRHSCIHLARDAVEAFEHVKAHPPDLVLVDWHLPGGAALDLARWLAGQRPPVAVLLLGLADAAQGEWARKSAGAAGYVLRTETFGDLLVRIEPVPAGDASCRPDTRLLAVASADEAQAPNADGNPKAVALTVREQQIVHLIEQGLSNKEIAKRLNVSLHTVKNHVHNLLGKLEVESRYEAARACASGNGGRPERGPSSSRG